MIKVITVLRVIFYVCFIGASITCISFARNPIYVGHKYWLLNRAYLDIFDQVPFEVIKPYLQRQAALKVFVELKEPLEIIDVICDGEETFLVKYKRLNNKNAIEEQRFVRIRWKPWSYGLPTGE